MGEGFLFFKIGGRMLTARRERTECSMYRKVPTNMDFVAREHDIEQFWKENKILDVYKRQANIHAPRSGAVQSVAPDRIVLSVR